MATTPVLLPGKFHGWRRLVGYSPWGHTESDTIERLHFLSFYFLWRRKWQPTPVFLPGESHGQRSLVGYSLWGCKESDTTKQLTHTHIASKVLKNIVQVYIYGRENCVQYIFKAQYYTFWVNLCVFFNIFPPLEYKLDKRVYIPVFPFSRIPITYYSLKQQVCAQLLSHVRLCNPMDCSPLGSSVHGILQEESLCRALLQRIIPTPGSNPGLLNWQAGSLLLSQMGSPQTTRVYYEILNVVFPR